MMDYLISNIGTIVVFLIIAAVVTLIVMKLRKDKADGKPHAAATRLLSEFFFMPQRSEKQRT